MDIFKYSSVPVTTLIIVSVLTNVYECVEHIVIDPPQVKVNVGEKVEVDCNTRSNLIQKNNSLQWETIDGSTNFEQRISSNADKSTLIISSAKLQDAGLYRCVYKDRAGKTSNKTLLVVVLDEDDDTDTVEIPSEPSEDHDQMIWLKTTVYTVIACTVGIVLLISVVVIAIFRIKMKRAAVRRAMRQAERRRRHGNRCGDNSSGPNGGGSRSRRNDPYQEHEPFISAPSPTHFGNIIVNVNNGVQYVPNAEFNTVVQAPPSYADVVAETGVVLVGRHSPPPEYSTIDRNPNRMSDAHLSASESFDHTLANNQITDTSASSNDRGTSRTNNNDRIQRSQSSGSNNQHSQRDMQQFQIPHEEVFRNQGAGNTQTLTHVPSGSVTETSSLGRRNCRGRNRQARNVRSVGSPRRPKQLKVRDGQIVLDESSTSSTSSNSSSPDTINRNTQTNPADILSTNQNSQTAAKPAQIQVQDGQIVLANEGSENSQRAESSVGHVTGEEGAVTPQGQGQLEVKDGQIVFKSPPGS